MTSANPMNSQAILDIISCPITHSIMEQPVQGPDGITYERAAIVRWLTEKGTSPMNPSLAMQASDLTVNYSIKHMIEQYKNGVFGSPEPAADTDRSTLGGIVSSISNTLLGTQPVNVSDKHNITELVTEKLDDNYLLTINSEIKSDAGNDPKRIPHDLVLVLDRSGSMGVAVSAKDEDGKNLENGFSQEDIVTHAARTVTKVLNSDDRLSVIVFDHSADLILESTQMNEQNKNRAMDEIKKIKPRGQTDIWKALLMAIDILNARTDKSRNSAIVLLTDGAPNSSPALGEVETLRRMRIRTNFSTPIYTCGFGYSLKRGLLYDLAKNAGGVTCHIPDGSMVATVFCNLIANILSTVAMNVQLHLLTRNGADVVDDKPVMGDYAYNLVQTTELGPNSKKYCVDIGTVQMQQSRDIILRLKPNTGHVEYLLTYKIGDKYYATTAKNISGDNTLGADYNIRSNIMRFYAVEELRRAILMMSRTGNLPNSNGIAQIQKIKDMMTDLLDSAEEGLLESLDDQITFALSNKTEEAGYFKKWGEFYLDQFTRCLNQQFCPNFRDKALSVFGGEKFTELMEESSDAFDRLEPPEPSLLPQQQQTSSYSTYSSMSGLPPAPAPARAQTMTQYNSRSQGTPCFNGRCIIRMANDTSKRVEKLQKNDMVWTPHGPARIRCVLQTNIPSGELEMVNISFNTSDSGCALSITPYHPVYLGVFGQSKQWIFPHSILIPLMTKCDAIYSLLLEQHHIVEIGGVQCICLAHEYTEDILAHDYFGTKKVVDDMCKMPGWDKGHIIVNEGCMVRDSAESNNNSLVIGMKYNGSVSYVNQDSDNAEIYI